MSRNNRVGGMVFVPPFQTFSEAQNTIKAMGNDLQGQINKLGQLVGTLSNVSSVVSTITKTSSTSSGERYSIPLPSSSGMLFGTHAVRLTTPALPNGQLFYETDRFVVYYSDNNIWWYFGRYMNLLLAGIPMDLTSSDLGFLFLATDYHRSFVWTGSVWTRAQGERPTREVIYSCENPGSGWQLCDGSSCTWTNDNATLSTGFAPNEIEAYRKGDTSYTGTVGSAISPIINTGTSSVVIGTDTSTSTMVLTTVGTTTIFEPHTHNATLNLNLTNSNIGEPKHLAFMPYMKL